MVPLVLWVLWDIRVHKVSETGSVWKQVETVETTHLHGRWTQQNIHTHTPEQQLLYRQWTPSRNSKLPCLHLPRPCTRCFLEALSYLKPTRKHLLEGAGTYFLRFLTPKAAFASPVIPTWRSSPVTCWVYSTKCGGMDGLRIAPKMSEKHVQEKQIQGIGFRVYLKAYLSIRLCT